MLDKFFCKVNDKQIEFPSEKEAIEYCKENDINPHGIILMGDRYIIKTKDSGFKTTMDEAIRTCDDAVSEYNKGLRSIKEALEHFYYSMETAENENIKKKAKEMYDKVSRL